MSETQLHFTSQQKRTNHVLSVAKELKLDVKNVKFFSGHDGMTGINADIYFEEKKFAHVYDDARDGEMEISRNYKNEGSHLILKAVEEKLSALPKYKVTFSEDINGRPIGGEPIEYETSVDLAEIVDTLATEKELQRIAKREQKKGIFYTDKEDTERLMQWKWPLALFLTKYPKHAKKAIEKAIKELKTEGCRIKYTEYLKSLGLSV